MCDYLSLPLEKKIDRVNLLRRAGEADSAIALAATKETFVYFASARCVGNRVAARDIPIEVIDAGLTERTVRNILLLRHEQKQQEHPNRLANLRTANHKDSAGGFKGRQSILDDTEQRPILVTDVQAIAECRAQQCIRES